MVRKNEITRRRERRVSAMPLNMSVCFHSTPKSSSCMKIAFFITRGPPCSSAMTASKYWISPRQSQPSSSALVYRPNRYSPWSK